MNKGVKVDIVFQDPGGPGEQECEGGYYISGPWRA